MAVKGDILQLRKEVEKMRETDTKLKSHKLCCQKAKEWFLIKNSKFMGNHSLGERSSTVNLPDECKTDMQFSEILGLLSGIKKEQKRLLMLKHQLHSAEMQQEVALLNEIILKQSALLSPHHGTTQLQDHSPLAMWFAEIAQSRKTESLADKFEGKFSETSQLFYNIHYCDGCTRQPQDLLVETIYKKKFQRDQRKKAESETLQFSTCHKGYCVQISISRSEDPSPYHIYCDIHLNELKERLLEYLASRKSITDLVRQHVWKEIENLPT